MKCILSYCYEVLTSYYYEVLTAHCYEVLTAHFLTAKLIQSITNGVELDFTQRINFPNLQVFQITPDFGIVHLN